MCERQLPLRPCRCFRQARKFRHLLSGRGDALSLACIACHSLPWGMLLPYLIDEKGIEGRCLSRSISGFQQHSQTGEEKRVEIFFQTCATIHTKTMVNLPVCPTCNHEYTEFPALSRIDNRTEICPTCGRIEALWEYYTRHAPKPSLAGFTNFLSL